MKNALFLFLIFVLFHSCKDSCPNSHTLGLYKTPEYIKALIKYEEVDNLTFISENHDTIHFSKVDEENLEIVSSFYKTVSCDENESDFVDLIYEREKSKYTYLSDLGDTINFSYCQSINLIINKYSDIEYVDPQYYHYIHIVLPNFGTEIKEGRAAWEDPESVDFFAKPLGENLEIANISYENVYYWEDNDLKVIFYNDTKGLIGFTDVNGIRWIRK